MVLDTSALGWVLVAIVAAVVEVATPQFGFIFVSAGALAAALVAVLGGSAAWQVTTCAIVIALSLTLFRPRIVKWLSRAPGVPSRTGPLVGRHGLVTHAIDPILGTGRVTVSGEDWAARSTSAVAAGVDVRVVGADGIVLEVVPL